MIVFITNMYRGIATTMTKIDGEMTRLRLARRKRVLAQQQQSLAARMKGKYEWRCSLNFPDGVVIHANTKSEARARFKQIVNATMQAKLGAPGRLGRMETLPPGTVVEQVV